MTIRVPPSLFCERMMRARWRRSTFCSACPFSAPIGLSVCLSALVNWQKRIKQPLVLESPAGRSLARSLLRCLACSLDLFFQLLARVGRRRRRRRRRRRALRYAPTAAAEKGRAGGRREGGRRQRLRQGCQGLFSFERDRKKAAATTAERRRTASIFKCAVTTSMAKLCLV